MRRIRQVAFWTLLATVLGGAVLGPMLHQLHHAEVEWETASCHSRNVHQTDVPLWTGAGGHVDTVDCDLCATRLLVVAPSFESGSEPTLGNTTQVTLRTHLTPVHVTADRSIRGPPFVSGARLV